MLDRFFECYAAKRDLRFREFIKAKEAYESVNVQISTPFHEMTEQHYRVACNDERLANAENGFTTAIQLSERAEQFADAAVARYQLGLIHHFRGKLELAHNQIHKALQVLECLPDPNRSSDVSSCHYHLGVIAMKQDNIPGALWHLHRSQAMDDAIGNIQGAHLCQAALQACGETEDKGTDNNIDVGQFGNNLDWDVPNNLAVLNTQELTLNVPGPTSARYDRREMICIASFSEEANALIASQMDNLGNEFGRPVTLKRVAFGSDDPSIRMVPNRDSDQHLAAVILVLERNGLNNHNYHEFVEYCMNQTLAATDFRLLVYRHNISDKDLQDLASQDALVKTLLDVVQISASPTTQQLRQALVSYIRRVDHIRDSAMWRDVRLRTTVVAANIATAVIIAAALIVIVGILMWTLAPNHILFTPPAPIVASIAMGILAFPMQSPLIFFVMRGMRTTANATRNNTSLMKWIVMGMLVMYAASALQHQLDGPTSWIIFGTASGILLESIRRSGYSLRREEIDIGSYLHSALASTKTIALKDDKQSPFRCPILLDFASRVFISYTTSSPRATRYSAALYKELKRLGSAPFLDRASIPTGTGWRRVLNQQLSSCDTFICILDKEGIESRWVAAELLTALEARCLTGTPEIFLLVDSNIRDKSSSVMPVFQNILASIDEVPIPGRPKVLLLNSQTRTGLMSALAPGRFVRPSLLPRLATLPVMGAIYVLSLLGAIGVLAGYIIGFLVLLEGVADLPLTSGLQESGWLAPVALLTAFWAGSMARGTISVRCEREPAPAMTTAIPMGATVGLIWGTFLFTTKLSALMLGWTSVLVVLGWMTTATLARGTQSTTEN